MKNQTVCLVALFALACLGNASGWAEDAATPGPLAAPPVEHPKTAEGQDMVTPLVQSETRPELYKVSKAEKKKLTARLQKREMAGSEILPVIQEILQLKWSVTPEQTEGEVRKITLERVFYETLERNLDVRKAKAQVKLAEAEGKELREPNLMTFLNPISMGQLKNAAEDNVKAAEWHVTAIRQKALLDSARLHADLVQAFLNKYLMFQGIEQGRRQLSAEEQRFIAGETTSFEVSQAQMALMERYGKYLSADNLYHSASIALSNHLGSSVKEVLVPEDYLQNGESVDVIMLNLIPSDFSLDQALKATENRPELQELRLKRNALSNIAKAAFGVDRDKREAELKQLDLEIQKALQGALSMTEKAFADYHLARQTLLLAKQRYSLASQFVHQLQVSYDAGFSSYKEVLDGQIEAEKAKTVLIGAQVAQNLSQIRLIYEMGLLDVDVLSKGITPGLL
jgi:predicted DNA-binding ribbon-helix-helix protein